MKTLILLILAFIIDLIIVYIVAQAIGWVSAIILALPVIGWTIRIGMQAWKYHKRNAVAPF
jgi:UPF0716 family protein affecting phage T7 exclusion